MVINQHLLNISKKPTLDSNDLKNYRPISNLSFLSKFIERVIANQFHYIFPPIALCLNINQRFANFIPLKLFYFAFKIIY